ncbi:MAG TPA: class I SAM-dependent methyltransferase [Casimicrobiaceae bacterium]|nr:class I SAM-dependent methyltransferase [Casimicrobiaceae bacterium]
MSAELRQSYDEFPYVSFPFPQSHPDRLATIGWLFGMEPARVEACRVLEVGCASGGNLIPMAASLPDSQFIGVDFSPVQIERGAADVKALRLQNVELLAMDIMDFSEAQGEFDYIIAHGVYSWVPNAVQERLLEICARQLKPSGIAYVSYNTLPGWRMRSVVRDAMTYHTRGIAEPAKRVAQARAVLEFLAETVKDDTSAYGIALRTEADHLRKQADYYILHDHLEEVNEPLYFHQFIERAARHGLGYLGEANFVTMLGGGFSQRVNETLARVAPEILKREQFIDFLRARTFRETLLVHRGVQLNRKISPDRVMALRIASRAKPVRAQPDLHSHTVEEFESPDGKVSTANRLTKAALLTLAECWPVSMGFNELDAAARVRAGLPGPSSLDQRGRLASEILQCFAAGVLELHYARSPFVAVAGERPEGSALARLQAQRGNPATTLRHEHGTFHGDTLRLFLMLDGTRTRFEIAALMWPGAPESNTLPELDAALNHLARLALMVK